MPQTCRAGACPDGAIRFFSQRANARLDATTWNPIALPLIPLPAQHNIVPRANPNSSGPIHQQRMGVFEQPGLRVIFYWAKSFSIKAKYAETFDPHPNSSLRVLEQSGNGLPLEIFRRRQGLKPPVLEQNQAGFGADPEAAGGVTSQGGDGIGWKPVPGQERGQFIIAPAA